MLLNSLKRMSMHTLRTLLALVLTYCCLAQAQAAHMGFTQFPQSDGGQTTVFYPTEVAESIVRLGPFKLSWAHDAQPTQGNGRLVVISHGSGGSPWVHVDLARTLVQHGFVVAVPAHKGDNYRDPSEPGPPSFARRPAEVSRSIDGIASHPFLARFLSLEKVGVFGGSAGGHTALSVAGGQWSESRLRQHCEQHIAEDFHSCAGFTTSLKGDGLDGVKIWVVRRYIAWRFSDETLHKDFDPRIQAAIAMVPYAADFDRASLVKPRIPLGLVSAAKDTNQIPRFHSEVIKAACLPRCEIVMDLTNGGHGSMLSPLPPLQEGSVDERLLSDPPGFDRSAVLPELNLRIANFFLRHLVGAT
jgi:predicted dienelactone hydrolase